MTERAPKNLEDFLNKNGPAIAEAARDVCVRFPCALKDAVVVVALDGEAFARGTSLNDIEREVLGIEAGRTFLGGVPRQILAQILLDRRAADSLATEATHSDFLILACNAHGRCWILEGPQPADRQ